MLQYCIFLLIFRFVQKFYKIIDIRLIECLNWETHGVKINGKEKEIRVIKSFGHQF